MNIRTKLNLWLVLVFLIGVGISAYVSYRLVHDNAREEVIRAAGLLMQTALSIRNYTVTQVKPNLVDKLAHTFLPQTVPAFAATETIEHLRKTYPSYSYREATLNPTNPRDRTSPWERDIVEQFKDSPDTKELVLERDTRRGQLLYIARPIKITNEGCLACHSTPAAAPASMIALYGDAGGFGWKMNEIVGTQLVSVPMALARQNANEALIGFLISIVAIFLLIFVVLNFLVGRLVISPLTRMAESANEISKGNFQIAKFDLKARDEVARLGASFNRMRVSLQKAIEIIQAKRSNQ